MTYRNDALDFGGADPLTAGEMMSALLARGNSLQAAWKAYDNTLSSIASLLQGGEAGVPALRALFGAPASARRLVNPLDALERAVSQLGVTEDQPGSNAGREVDAYLGSVGLEGGYAWRMAFVHWCFQSAAEATMTANPLPRTAGCLDAWNMTDPARRISRARAMLNPDLVQPGMVFVLDLGGGAGHAGFVRQVSNGALVTVECALDPAGAEGAFGVQELQRRRITDKALKGFLDFR